MITRTKLLALPVAGVLSVLVATTASADITALSYNSPAQLSVTNTVATVTGQVACSTTDVAANVFVEILQSQGRQLVIASGETSVSCLSAGFGGTTQPWTVLASTTQGQALKTGSASIFVSANNEIGTSFKSVAGSISLTH
jgi:hypothetical protein